MGIIISRFKKKKTTLEILEKLEKDIVSIEKYSTNTEQRRRRLVGQLVVYSVGVYVLSAAFFYFYWFPDTLVDRFLYASPLFVLPVVALLLKNIITFYYSRKITKNNDKLHELRDKKKKILEEVMDKETYKVARTILEKFDPEQLRSKDFLMSPNKPNNEKTFLRSGPLVASTPSRPMLPSDPANSVLRRRTLPLALGNPVTNPGPPSSLSSDSLSTVAIQRSQFLSGTPLHRPSINGQGFSSEYRPPGPPLPRPVLPRERTYLDRVVEYVVGDGPSNRFALICSSCDSHNGMALKEEFEYLSFRCCYCHYFNPARKQRPQAPRISLPLGSGYMSETQQSQIGRVKEDSSTSDSEKNSASDSSNEESETDPEPLKSSDTKVNETKETVAVNQPEERTSSDREAEEFCNSCDGNTPIKETTLYREAEELKNLLMETNK